MKIAISGAAGTGKSTLIQRLTNEMGIAIVPEYSRLILRNHNISKPHQYPEELGGGLGFQSEVINRKHVSEAEKIDMSISYVGDRSLLDCGAYTLFFYGQNEKQAEVMEMVDFTIDWSKNIYDMIFLRPFDFRHVIEDDGFRSLKLGYHQAIYSLILGMLVEHQIPYTPMPYDLDEAFKMIKAYITTGETCENS